MCATSIKKHPILSKMSKEPGTRIKVKCFKTCKNVNDKVIGNKIYSENTDICASAYHSGVIKKDN